MPLFLNILTLQARLNLEPRTKETKKKQINQPFENKIYIFFFVKKIKYTLHILIRSMAHLENRKTLIGTEPKYMNIT